MAGEKRGGLFQAAFGWLDRFLSLWSFVSGLGILSVGGLTAWAAWAANIFSVYSPFSWIVAGIGGAAAATLIILTLTFTRLKWAQASAVNRWSETVASVNPLEDTFRNQRIRIMDLVSPISPRITGKTFIGCELLGPANLAIWASKPGGGQITGVSFADCDWVIVKQGARPNSAVLLEDCSVLGGTIYKATFYMSAPEYLRVTTEFAKGNWLTEVPQK